MKCCKVCRESKPESNFSPHPDMADRLDARCKSCRRNQSKEHYRISRETLLPARREKRKTDESVRLWHREYARRRRQDPTFRLRAALRTRLIHALRGRNKSARTLELLGCPVEYLRAHLEKQFAPSMAWENWGVGEGYWQVDHIRPCDAFDLTDPAQQRQCFHFSNLQPLWFIDNVRKGAKVTEAVS